MSLFASSLAELHISSDGITYLPVAGLKRHQIRIQQQALSNTDLEDGAWKMLAQQTGLKQAIILAEGLFTNSGAEQLILSQMLAASFAYMKLLLPNGNDFSGQFLITDYMRAEAFDEEEAFAIKLESAGALTYTTA